MSKMSFGNNKDNSKYSLGYKVGVIISIILIAIAVIGVFWTPYSQTDIDVAVKNQAPSLDHIFGTDNYGRDIFSRIMGGLGTTLFIALSTVLIGGGIGTVIGLYSGYHGGIFDEIVMRISDMILSFPSILLALIFVSIMGASKYNVIFALGILFVPSFARIVRGETVKIKNLDYIKCAITMGAGTGRIVFRHILPNAWGSLLSALIVGINNAILAEAGMSYLGLGVQPPEASLGRMMSEAQSYLFTSPWFAIFPGLVIILLVLAFSLVGEGLQSKKCKNIKY